MAAAASDGGLAPELVRRLDALAVGTATGIALGIAARSSPRVARQLAFRDAIETYDRRRLADTPAFRGAADQVWVATQIAKREDHVRRIAESLGLDPDAAVEAVRAQGWPAFLARHGGRAR